MVRTLRSSPVIAPAVHAAVVLAFLLLASPAGAATVFSDGFESGSMSAWSHVASAAGGGTAVQSQLVRGGAQAARLWATSTAGSHAFARRSLASPQFELTVAADLRVVSGGWTGNVPLLRLFDAGGNRLVSLYRQNQDGDRVYVQHSGRYHGTSGTLALHSWRRFEVTVRVAGDQSRVVARVDGTVIHDSAAWLGGAGVHALQIGNDTAAQPFDLAADNVTASTPTYDATASTPTTTSTASACDPAGPVPTSPDPGTVVLADNFESGLGHWIVTQQGDARITSGPNIAGARDCVARLAVTANSGSLANLTRPLPYGTREIWADGWFHFLAQGASWSWNVPTFRLFSDGRRVLDVSRQNGTGDLFVRYPNGSGGWTLRSTGLYPALGRWYQVKIHALANWNGSTVEVWLDGTRIFATWSATLGVGRFGVLMIGADHARQEGVIAVDDVVVKARS